MNRTEALRLIESYLEGSLAGQERMRFEELVRQDETVGCALQHAKELDQLLASQCWMTPSEGFTHSVMTEVGLMPALERATVLENLLEDQAWLTPSAAFTQQVMAKVGLPGEREVEFVQVSRRELFADWIEGLAPAAAVIAVAVVYGKTIWENVVGYLQTSGAVLDSVFGIRIFEQQPLIQLGIIVPLLGSAIISAMVTRRLRLTS